MIDMCCLHSKRFVQGVVRSSFLRFVICIHEQRFIFGMPSLIVYIAWNGKRLLLQWKENFGRPVNCLCLDDQIDLSRVIGLRLDVCFSQRVRTDADDNKHLQCVAPNHSRWGFLFKQTQHVLRFRRLLDLFAANEATVHF